MKDKNFAKKYQTLFGMDAFVDGRESVQCFTDMAYPMQAKEGITVWFADEPYKDVIAYVKRSIENSPHVYQDEELSILNEDLCRGITAFKQDCAHIFGHTSVRKMAHEQLMAKLDDVSENFQVLIIKTNWILPYTTLVNTGKRQSRMKEVEFSRKVEEAHHWQLTYRWWLFGDKGINVVECSVYRMK